MAKVAARLCSHFEWPLKQKIIKITVSSQVFLVNLSLGRKFWYSYVLQET